jgi:hypothetical protein
MADVFEAQVMPNEEIEALKRYSQYAQKAGDTYNYIRGIEFMAIAYDLLGDTAMILATEEKAHNLYKRNSFLQSAAASYATSLYIYMNRGDYGKARQLMKILETESGLFDDNGNISEGREHYYYIKGLYYLGTKQLDSAEYEFKRLIPYGYTFDAYHGLIEVTQQRKDATAVLAYTKLYEESLDTLVTNIHAEAIRQAEGMYDYTRHQRIAMEKSIESERNRNIIYLLVFVVTIIAFILYHLYRRNKAKKKREIERLSNQYMDALTRYEQAKEEVGIIETDFTTFRQRKQEELLDLQQQLSNLHNRYGNIEQAERIEAIKQSPVWEAFMDRLDPKKKTKPISDKEWDKLTILFSQCVPSLYARMTENNILNPHEKRVTILTRLGLSPKNISLLMETFPQRVSNARESANMKLFSDSSSRTFLANLSQV